MSKKLSYEEVKEFIESLGYELISEEYIDNREKLTLKDNANYYYSISSNNLKHDHIPRKFDAKNPYTLANIQNWCVINLKEIKLISKKYVNANAFLTWQCLKPECGEIFEMGWGSVYTGSGCSFCAGKKVSISNCLATKRPDMAKQWHPTKNNITPFDVVCGSHRKVWWICENGHGWPAAINNRTILNRGCPFCNNSHGENFLKSVFDKKDESYISQKTFDGLIGLGGGLLSYDFYLPKYNLLVEYQGEYHDRAICLYKGEPRELAEKRYKKQQEHDERKRKYALANGYNLLEIWYYNLNNIEDILQREIFDKFD